MQACKIVKLSAHFSLGSVLLVLFFNTFREPSVIVFYTKFMQIFDTPFANRKIIVERAGAVRVISIVAFSLAT